MGNLAGLAKLRCHPARAGALTASSQQGWCGHSPLSPVFFMVSDAASFIRQSDFASQILAGFSGVSFKFGRPIAPSWVDGSIFPNGRNTGCRSPLVAATSGEGSKLLRGDLCVDPLVRLGRASGAPAAGEVEKAKQGGFVCFLFFIFQRL